jgi:hypothetical protein
MLVLTYLLISNQDLNFIISMPKMHKVHSKISGAGTEKD